MLKKFALQYAGLLAQNGFKTLGETAYGAAGSPHNIMLKSDGPVWYAAVMINAEQVSLDGALAIDGKHWSYFKNLAAAYNINNIFIVNLFYGMEHHSEIADYIMSTGEFVDEGVNSIYWYIELATGQFVLNNSQPTQVLNLRKLIDESYRAAARQEDNVVPIHFSKLNEKAGTGKPFQPVAKSPVITYVLLVVNLLVFALMELNGGTTNSYNLVRFGALVPFGITEYTQYYRLVTSMFIHIGMMHIAFNCLSLYIFGTRIEKYYGRIAFVLIYFFSGVTGAILSWCFLTGISAGASGAIYGLVGAMAVLTRKASRRIEGLNYYTMLIYIIVGIGIGFIEANVDNFGHLGGLIGGVLISTIILKIKGMVK